MHELSAGNRWEGNYRRKSVTHPQDRRRTTPKITFTLINNVSGEGERNEDMVTEGYLLSLERRSGNRGMGRFRRKLQGGRGRGGRGQG